MAKSDQTIKGVSVAAMMEEAKKQMGADVGQIGGDFYDTTRIPTGLFEFDVATGGGFPCNKVSLIFGNESSNKTVHAMLAIASHQRLYPDKVCAYLALEGYTQTDKKWFAQLGVDVERLAVFMPAYAEQVVDIVDSFLWANDAGLMVLDSIAGMMTVTEFENSAEKQTMGGAGVPISKMGRKIMVAMNKSPAKPTLILINQPRQKIGIAYGDPTVLPGGPLVNKFLPGMIIRLYGKNEMDTKYSKALPVSKAVTLTVMKWKVPILSQAAEYSAVMIPHKGLRVGQSDWLTFSLGLRASSGPHPNFMRRQYVEGFTPCISHHSAMVLVWPPRVIQVFTRVLRACSTLVAQRQLLGS